MSVALARLRHVAVYAATAIFAEFSHVARAAKRFARLREVARIAAGFEVTGFARIDPVLRRAGEKIPTWSDTA